MNLGFINQNDVFVEYNYKITEFYILIGTEVTELPIERITDFKIENFFEEASFPIFKINTVMEASRYYNIVKNKNNVKMKVRIQSFYHETKEDTNSMLRDVINDTFSIFLNDNNADFDEDLKREAGTIDDINQLDKLLNNVELYLFKDTYVTNLRSSFNAVLNNINMSTTLAYLLHKAGIKNVLMSPIENTKVYDTLLLPPMSIENQFKYLNNNYGFYKKGGIVFFGLIHSYILNCKQGCTAWCTNEWTEVVIYVLDKSSNSSYLSGAVHKPLEERYYFTVKTEGIDIANLTISSNVLSGTDALAIDMKNATTTTVSANAITKGISNKTVLFNNTSNPFMAETYAAQQHANSTVLSLVIENTNIEAFTPNKTFSIIFENAVQNEKYKGVYRLATAIHSFTKSGECYLLTTAITLKRVS